MYDIALDANTHDILITNKNFMIINNAERVAQQIKITLKLIYGEWFLNTTKGVPYFGDILKKNPNLQKIKLILKKKILSVEGVISVKSINLKYNNTNRSLTVDFEANTKYGIVTRKEVLGYNG